MEKEEKGIHWRTTAKALHCGVEMLPEGKDIEYILIKYIEYKDKVNIAGRMETNKAIAYFEENPYTKLPMVLNATNCKRLEKLSGTPYLNELKNFPVRLTKEKCRDVQDGGETVGLRISKLPPKKPLLAVLSPEHPNWGKCMDYIKKGNSVEDLRKGYEISAEVEKLLIEETKK